VFCSVLPYSAFTYDEHRGPTRAPRCKCYLAGLLISVMAMFVSLAFAAFS
jgi:hypothetical protein